MPKSFNWNPISSGSIPKTKLTKIRKDFKLSKIASEILYRRGLTEKPNIKKYLFGAYKDLYNPFLFKDMLKAITLILQTIKNKKKIMIHGDYDVDGITSTAMIKMMFENMDYHNVLTFCPSRALGYGLSKQAVELAIKEKVNLLITCDCGSNEHTSLRLAKKNKINVIVLDHHNFQKQPKVFAFINPCAGEYPFEHLCGAGVAFKLLQAMAQNQPQYKLIPSNYLDFVALATVADSEPLIDENRILVKLGLKQLSKTHNTGLIYLLKACGYYQKKISTEVVGFIIAPKLNAPGRMSSPQVSLDLLLTIDNNEAERLAKELVKINKERIELNHKIRDEALEQVESKYKEDCFLVLENNSWSKGIIGIVASTMVEIYHKPTAIISNGYGSVRTVPEFSLLEPLSQCSEFLQKWGGHPMAAGLHMKKNCTDKFRIKINEISGRVLSPNPQPYMTYDSKIKLRDVNLKIISELEKLEPFGMGNQIPYFVMEDVHCARDRITNDGQHMQLSLSQKGSLVSAIGFWLAGHKELIIDPAQKFDLLCMLERSKYDTEQIIIKDLKEVILNW